MEIIYMPRAQSDITNMKKSGNVALMKKAQALLVEIAINPYFGTGKPEQLKYDLSGYWSRRINKEHRIIYKVLEETDTIEIYSLQGHYEN